MNEFDISVIIPMYNGGNKILKCLKALSNQTFTGNYEVLIVDDASKDDSVNIVKNCITNLSRSDCFKLIECDTNGRAGSARNIGLKKACGEYITFIDQDDYPDKDYLKKLYELTANGSIDCVYCNVMETSGKAYVRPIFEKIVIDDFFRKSAVTKFGYVFAMLLRRDFLMQIKLFFPENLLFEDVLYNAILFSRIEKIQYIPECLYYRVGDIDSQTANLSSKKLLDRIKATKWYLTEYEEIIRHTHCSTEINNLALYYISLSCAYFLTIVDNQFIEEVCDEIISFIRDNKISKKIALNVAHDKNMPVDSYNIIQTIFLGKKKLIRKIRFIKFKKKIYTVMSLPVRISIKVIRSIRDLEK